jgi:hypothetical protein
VVAEAPSEAPEALVVLGALVVADFVLSAAGLEAIVAPS